MTTYNDPFRNISGAIPRDEDDGIHGVLLRGIDSQIRRPGWASYPVALADAISKHIRQLLPEHAALNVENRRAVGLKLYISRVVAPTDEGVAIFKSLETTHGARVNSLWVKVLLNDLCGHGLGVDFKVESTALACARLTETSALAMVVEQGDLGFVIHVKSSIVLPTNVGSSPIAEIPEHVALSAENPDRLARGAVDEGDGRHVPSRNEIIARLGLANRVDMEEIEARVGSHAVRLIVAGKGVGIVKVLGGLPIEKELVCSRINGLKA